MKNFVKYAAVGLIGYFVGFYEMKYKVLEILATINCDEDKEQKEDSKEE